MSETPLPNATEARTPTGELKDQAAPLTTTETKPVETTTSSTTPSDTTTAEVKPTEAKVEAKPEDKSLLNKDEPLGAPETYAPFTAPEGYELNAEVVTEAQTIFKEMGLSQASAQKLVDFYSKQITSVSEAPYNTFNEVQADWQAAVMADPTLGPRIAQVKANIGRALDSLGDPKLAADFRLAMDMTGAGNHPAFVKAFDKFAERLNEGTHVGGKNPSPLGQKGPNDKPASIANAMYPNLG